MRNKELWIAIVIGLWLVALVSSGDRCERAWFSYGIDVGTCPDGELRQSARLAVSGLRRGASGQVSLQVFAHYTTADADAAKRASVPRVTSIELALTGAENAAWPLEAAFTVEPFTLPRFRVDAIADKPFYQAGDRPIIKGAVIYSSGAPVAAAALDLTWETSGDWPPRSRGRRACSPGTPRPRRTAGSTKVTVKRAW